MRLMTTAHSWAILAAAGSLAAGLTGCASLFPDNSEAVALREDMVNVRDEVGKLAGRIEGLEMETQRLRSDLDALRAAQARPPPPAVAPERVDELERRLQAIDAAREKDKQELIDKLSKTIADMMKSSGGARPSSGHRRTGSDSGYEHVVKPGETISEIAKAYGAKVNNIVEANQLKDPNHLRAGQKLFIPE
jgi:nucleoid-associated protein YgaU